VEAAIALGKIGDAVAVPALAFALDDEEHNVQIYSAKSIALLTGQKFTDMNGPGYLLDENKNPILVLKAKEW